MDASQTIRAGVVCALVGVGVLVAMALVGLPAGESLAIIGQPASPEDYAATVGPQSNVLLSVMALDNIFVIAYTGTFIGAAALVWRRARLLGAVGLGFAVLLALLDLSENAITVDIARAAQEDVPIPGWEITFLGLLEQLKYASGTLAIAYFAIALLITKPAARALTVGVSIIFLGFPVVNALTVLNPDARTLLILWMLLMLLASAVLLWRSERVIDNPPIL